MAVGSFIKSKNREESYAADNCTGAAFNVKMEKNEDAWSLTCLAVRVKTFKWAGWMRYFQRRAQFAVF